MKCFLKGYAQPFNSVPKPEDISYVKPEEPKHSITVGPDCFRCVFSVRDIGNTQHCLLYNKDIAEFNVATFEAISKEFREKHNCKMGEYILKE